MLKRLYSPTKLLVKDITFHAGINLIIGEYSHTDRRLGTNNGIGKSSVVRLIDYLLLSESAARFFQQKKYDFLREEGHTICLDVLVKGELLKITRDFDTRKKLVHLKRGDGVQLPYTTSEAAAMLSEVFFPQTKHRLLPGMRFGSLMTFYVKDDLENLTRKNPIGWLSHGGANARELSTLNLFLMGIPNAELISFNSYSEKIALGKKLQNELIKKAETAAGKTIAQLRSEIGTREKQLKALQEAFDKYDLFKDYQQVSNDIGTFSSRINEVRKQLEQVNRQLARLRNFAETTQEVDVEDLSFQYAQVSGALGNVIKRSLEDVFAFRESLAEERLKFHAKSMASLEISRTNTLAQLQKLEADRSVLYKVMDETGAAQPLRGAVERIATERMKLAESQANIQQIADMDKELDVLSEQAEISRRKVYNSLEEFEAIIRSLQEIFVEVVTDALALQSQIESEQAYLDISRAKTRAGFPVTIEASVPRAEALGNSRLKLAAYDLTIFLHSLEKGLPLPHFLIHDGVFHGISRLAVLRALNFMHKKLVRYEDAQYVTTFNREELPRPNEDEVGNLRFEFDIGQSTVITLEDTPEKMLFQRKI